MWLFIAGFIATLVGCIYTWLAWNLNYWRKRGVPGPDAQLLAGSFPKAFYHKQNLVYEIDSAYKLYRHKTPYFGFLMSRTPSLVVIDPVLIKKILTTNFKSFHDNYLFVRVNEENDPLLARNPFMLCGEQWKEKRSEVAPAFTNVRMKNMYPIMEHVAQNLTTYLRSKLETKPIGVDVKDLGSRFTADAVANSIFGVDGKGLSNEHSEILEKGSTIFDNTKALVIYNMVVQFLPFVERFWKMSMIPKHIEQFFSKLTRDAVRMRTESNATREDILNYLIQLRQRKQFEDIDMTGHAMTFFLDGYETSSMVIANTIIQLAKNPEAQDKLRREIESVVSPGTSITFDQIMELEYLDQVIHESLRISPVIGFALKVCTEHFEFVDYKDHKVTVEKGTPVYIPSYSIHHDEEHYPNPETFDPNRFSAENGGIKSYRDKGVFLSFGDGPRICFGMRYGMMQVKVAIVELVRNFALKTNTKTQQPAVFDPENFLLSQVGGLWADFVPIKH